MASNRKLFALVAATLMLTSVFLPGLVAGTAAAANDGIDAGNTGLSVSTDEATSVTNTSAELNGNLTDLGGAEDANVSFQYWVEGDDENRTTLDIESLNETGTFATAVDGLANNTTYVYVARADDGDTIVAGNQTTFTTGAASDDGFEMIEGPFGQNVERFVSYLMESGDHDERNLGQAVSEWVTANNPGVDNRPDHAGPPDHVGDDDDDDRRGPPEDTENEDDEEELEDEEDEEDDDDDRGGPPEGKGYNK